MQKSERASIRVFDQRLSIPSVAYGGRTLFGWSRAEKLWISVQEYLGISALCSARLLATQERMEICAEKMLDSEQ